MTVVDIGLLVFLAIMIPCGIVYEIDKRKKRQKMEDLLVGKLPSYDSELLPAYVVDSSVDDPGKRLSEILNEQMALSTNQLNPKTAIEFEEYQKRMESLEVAYEKANSEFKSWLEPSSSEHVELHRIDSDHFHADESYLSDVSNSGIAIDRSAKKFALVTTYDRVIIDFSEVVASEVLVDSEAVVKTDRVGQIGGAVIGGVLTGGIGALVMAMGAKKKQVETVRRVDLKVLTSNVSTPVHNVCFYQRGRGSAPSIGVNNAERWHDLLTVAIHGAKASGVSRQSQSGVGEIGASFAADEIRKLAQLKADGLLSEEEFTLLKSNILQPR